MSAPAKAALLPAGLLNAVPKEVLEPTAWWQRHLTEALTELLPGAAAGEALRPVGEWPHGARSPTAPAIVTARLEVGVPVRIASPGASEWRGPGQGSGDRSSFRAWRGSWIRMS